MKKIIVLPFLILLIVSCKQNEVKIEKKQFLINSNELLKVNIKIEQFLKDTIENIDSFIPKEGIFKVDSAFNSPLENINLRKMLSKYIDAEERFDSLDESIADNKYIYKNSFQREKDSLSLKSQYEVVKTITNELRYEYSNYKKKFIGWEVKYQFQIDDFKNEKRYVNCIFIFDASFDKILKFKDNLSDNDSYFKENIIDKLGKEGFEKSLKLLKFDKK